MFHLENVSAKKNWWKRKNSDFNCRRKEERGGGREKEKSQLKNIEQTRFLIFDPLKTEKGRGMMKNYSSKLDGKSKKFDSQNHFLVNHKINQAIKR